MDYLIEYQQQAMFLAYLCRFAQVLGVVEPHAASALHHRFEDKRCQFLVMLLYQFRSSTVSRSSHSPWKRERGCGTK